MFQIEKYLYRFEIIHIEKLKNNIYISNLNKDLKLIRYNVII